MIYPQPYFARRLLEERNRSDRTGRPFSLVLISMDKINRNAEDLAYFFHALDKFLESTRLSDFWGWYSESKIGLLLPDTGEIKAENVLVRLKNYFEALNNFRLNELVLHNGLVSIMEYPKALKENISLGILEGPTSKENIEKCNTFINSSNCLIESRFIDNTALSQKKRTNNLYSKLDDIARRCLDILVTLLALLLLALPMISIAVLIKLTSRGPTLFKQTRVGKDGREFIFLKFRTMVQNCNQDLHEEYVTHLIENRAEKYEMKGVQCFKLVNDSRVTPLGKFLRKTSLDELPQLINVLKGEMSLVGPRPHPKYEAEKYKTWHLRRILEAKPGITGLWQVNGRSSTTYDGMVRLDLKYVETQSLWLNILILVRTVKAVLSMKGAC